MVEEESSLSKLRQFQLLGLSSSSYYYQAAEESRSNLHFMRLMDEHYLNHPSWGYRRMWWYLSESLGYEVNHKRVLRLMRKMNIRSVLPHPRTSIPNKEHKIYPYLLRDVKINRPNQVWSTDITYIPMAKGFMYLVAVIDWYSRYVLSWTLSNSLETAFCVEALEAALEHGQPDIFNTDQGSQFTSLAFTSKLINRGIKVSMDGKGRAIDNVFIERLWWSVKYEDVYLKAYENGLDLYTGLDKYFNLYNTYRPHQSLQNKTPEFVYSQGGILIPSHS